MNEQTFWAQYDTWQATKGKDAPVPLWKQYQAEASRYDAERRRLDGLLTDRRREIREFGINTLVSSACATGFLAFGAAVAPFTRTDSPVSIIETALLLSLGTFTATYAAIFYRQYTERKKDITPLETEHRAIIARFTEALAKQDLYKRTDAVNS